MKEHENSPLSLSSVLSVCVAALLLFFAASSLLTGQESEQEALSADELQLRELEGQRALGLQAIRAQYTEEEAEQLHDAKVRYLEANEATFQAITDLRRKIALEKQQSAPPPPEAIPLERSDFASEEEWTLHLARKQVRDRLQEIRTTFADDSEALHDAKVRYLADNEELLQSIRKLEFQLAPPAPVAQERPQLERGDFPTEKRWQLYQLESQAADALQEIRQTHADDDEQLHDAKVKIS